ncbi:MAG: choice-of-anchor Q domain-containing protein [Isosphaerales bacterium]
MTGGNGGNGGSGGYGGDGGDAGNGGIGNDGGNGGSASGGGLYVAGGTVTITAVTINGNVAQGAQGGFGGSGGAGGYGGGGGGGGAGEPGGSGGQGGVFRTSPYGYGWCCAPNGAPGAPGNPGYGGHDGGGGDGGNGGQGAIGALGSGGGLFVGGGSLTLNDATIDNDIAAGGGGGGGASGGRGGYGSGSGAGGNRGSSSVGGYGRGGGLDVNVGTATLDNTIVALNTNRIGSRASADDIAGAVSSASAYNLIGTGGTGGLTNGTNYNQVGVADPGLDPNGLQNNGGPTQTIALLAGSPAIDAGSNALAVDPTTGEPLANDQRGPGFPRIVNGTVDIGAFEYHIPLTLTSIASVASPRNTPVSSLEVTFDQPINLGTFTDSALALTDNGGPNLITGAVTVTSVSGSTYQINGLSGLTTSNGDYDLTVNAASIQDQLGDFGTNTLSSTWLMDTAPPTSHVNALAKRGTSLTFAVSVTGSDLGNPPSGVASYDTIPRPTAGPGRSGRMCQRPIRRPRSPGRATRRMPSTALPTTSRATPRARRR